MGEADIGRHERRLVESLFRAFDHACADRELTVATEVFALVELILRRQPDLPNGWELAADQAAQARQRLRQLKAECAGPRRIAADDTLGTLGAPAPRQAQSRAAAQRA